MCAPSSYRSVRTTRITRCSSGRPGSFSSNSVYDRARNRLYAERHTPIAHASAEPTRAGAGKGASGLSLLTKRRAEKSTKTGPLPDASTVAC